MVCRERSQEPKSQTPIAWSAVHLSICRHPPASSHQTHFSTPRTNIPSRLSASTASLPYSSSRHSQILGPEDKSPAVNYPSNAVIATIELPTHQHSSRAAAWQLVAPLVSCISSAALPMHAVRQSVRPKHQVLILKCYPRFQKGVADVKPNPSELSYLLYYASTRRSKVQKVGAFLEKKSGSDVSRGRIGWVYLSL